MPLAETLPAAPVLALMAFGVVMATVGHAAKSYKVVGVGLAMLFLSTALMVLGGFAAFQTEERDPRPCDAVCRQSPADRR